jgi:hypothetical protein
MGGARLLIAATIALSGCVDLSLPAAMATCEAGSCSDGQVETGAPMDVPPEAADAAQDSANDTAADAARVSDVSADAAGDPPSVPDVGATADRPAAPPDAIASDVAPGPDSEPDSQPPPVDAGRPGSVVFVGTDSTPSRGPALAGVTDTCPAGQVITGFFGSFGSNGTIITELGAQCGTVRLVDAVATFMLTVGSGATLTTRGTAGTAMWTRSCPMNQVVTAFDGRAGLYMDQLTFSCAPLSVDPQGRTISVGNAGPLASAGDTGGTAFADSFCPAGEVAVAARTHENFYIDGLALVCGTPTVVP